MYRSQKFRIWYISKCPKTFEVSQNFVQRFEVSQNFIQRFILTMIFEKKKVLLKYLYNVLNDCF